MAFLDMLELLAIYGHPALILTNNGHIASNSAAQQSIRLVLARVGTVAPSVA